MTRLLQLFSRGMSRLALPGAGLALLVQSAAVASEVPSAVTPAVTTGVTTGVTTTDVDAVVHAELATTWSPGCALAVVKGGQVVHSAGYGLASIEHQAPVKPSTVFPIASVTKHFTAVLTLMLVDEGKLTLEDPISKWLDGIPEEWKPVTIRQLLSHQSGITAYTADKEFRKSACREFEPKEIIAFAASKPMRFAPGTQSGYSNTNHFLAGLVIEKISGKRYCEVVAERFFEPLGMTSTRCAHPSAIIPGIADGYTGASLAVVRRAERVSASHAGGSGALVSTIEDLVKWDAALQGGKLLRPERVRQLETITTTNDGTQTPHGLGWVVEEPGSHRALVQSGSLPGFNAAIVRLPDDDLFVVAMVNSDMVSAGHLSMQVAALWFPTMVAARVPVADTNPKLTARLKAIILSLPAGTVSADEFTPEAAAQLLAGPLEKAGTFLSGLGSLQSFAVVDERALEGGLVQYRTKLSYEKLDLAATWALNADGKIAGLNLGPL